MSHLYYKFWKLFFVLSLAVSSTMSYASTPLGTPDPENIEYPEDEPPSKDEIDLGKKLFFDVRLSANHTQSCATCHNPDLGFSDGMPTSQGAMGNRVSRNSPSLYNLAWNVVFFWDGRANSLEEQALGPIQAQGEMNLSLQEAIKRISNVEYYRKAFQSVYGSDSIEPELLARAIAAFERSIITRDSPFDRYIAGDKTAMSPGAIRGLALFKGKANCTKCHDGPNFTDNSFHNIGLNDSDPGRGAIVGDAKFNKTFKTPGLRNISLTAPYMHDGSEATLLDVVEFYNRGGDNPSGISALIQRLNLTNQEKVDLVAFLGSLTDPVRIERPHVPE